MRRVVEGIVLRETETRETDKVLTVLTKTEGKITVIARGARRKRSRIGAAAQLLVYSEMTLFQQGKWCIMDEASTAALFSGLRREIERFALASYFAELTEAATAEDVPSPEALSLLLNALYVLSEWKKPLKLVKAAFELRLLQWSGYAPLLDRCAVCGTKTPHEPMLDILQGTLHCKKCGSPYARGLSMPLCDAALQAMRYVLTCPPKGLYAFRVSDQGMQRMADAVEAFSLAQMERSFPALRFYQSLFTPVL